MLVPAISDPPPDIEGRLTPFFLLAFVLVCKLCVGAYSVETRKKGVLLSAGERANERGTDVWLVARPVHVQPTRCSYRLRCSQVESV